MLAAFKSTEVAVAAGFALLVEAAIAALLIWANSSASLAAERQPEVKEVAIAVQPVLDLDTPLLKQGAKLPKMWSKPKPKPKPRYEDKTAASTKAEKNIEKIDKTAEKKELQKADKEVPPDENAELAKKVDEQVPEEDTDKSESQMPEQGAEDGVKEGTETDPLKAFVISQYALKVQAWFKAGFVSPDNACDAKLGVTVRLGSDRSVTGYTLAGSSGNAAFDARVKAHMDSKVGGQVPPPPPKYSDILNAVINLKFSGKTSACKNTKPAPGGSPEKPPSSLDEPADNPEPVPAPEPAPEPPAPEEGE